MAQVNPPVLSFNGGALGKLALANIDQEKYDRSCALARNCWPLVQGALIKAPGTRYIGATSSNAAAVARPFVYSADPDQNYALILTDGALQFVQDDGFIELEGGAATIGNWSDSSESGASVTTGAGDTTLTAGDGPDAIARRTITTTEPSAEATFSFEVTRRPLKIRFGTSAGGTELLTETTLKPGLHMISVTPGAATYYFQAKLDEYGVAQIKNMARVAAGLLTVPTPWAEADLRSLRQEQRGDQLFLFLRGVRTRVLERRGHTSWSLRYYAPDDGPFGEDEDGAITFSAKKGVATVTADRRAFAPTDIGRLIQAVHVGQYVSKAMTADDDATDAIRTFGSGAANDFDIVITGTFTGTVKLQRSFGNDTDWGDWLSYTSATTAHVTPGPEADNQVVYFRAVMSSYVSGTATVEITYSSGVTNGVARIAAYTDPTSVTVDILSTVGKTSATQTWAFGAWSDGEGWPSAGALHGGRLWLARDAELWGSKSGLYEEMALGVEDNDAIDRPLDTGELNQTVWLKGVTRLIAGTAGAAVQSFASNLDELVTPTNQTIKAATTRGAADCDAVKADGDLIFVSLDRQKLMGLIEQPGGGYVRKDFTRLNADIAGGANAGFIELAVAYAPEPRIFAVRADGVMAVLLYEPTETVEGWAEYDLSDATGAAIESVTVLPGAPEQQVIMIVKRTIGGMTKRYVERLAAQKWATKAEAWRLACALDKSGSAFTAITGLDHLEGESVYAWADGLVQGPFTVSGGAITLDVAADYALVGLNYVGRWRSARLAVGAQKGTALGQEQQVKRIAFMLADTAGGALAWGPDFDTINGRLPSAAPGGSTIWDADYAENFEGPTQLDPRVCLLMDAPAPVCLTAYVPHLDTRER